MLLALLPSLANVLWWQRLNMRCHRCGCVKVFFLSKEPHFAQKRGKQVPCTSMYHGVWFCCNGVWGATLGSILGLQHQSLELGGTHTTGAVCPNLVESRNLGALVKALHKLHDLFTTAVRRSPQGCVSNRPMCSLSTWKSLTRHTAFYIASCQLHSSEVPIVVSCNHWNRCLGLKLLQWSSATKDMACLEIRPLCQLHPRSTVQKPLQMKLGHLPYFLKVFIVAVYGDISEHWQKVAVLSYFISISVSIYIYIYT